MLKKKRKRGVRSKPKGSSWELKVANQLTEKTGREFRRVPLSGAWMGGQNQAKNVGVHSGLQEGLTGDIIGPDNWPFTMECKNTASYPRFHMMVAGNDAQLDKWIEEAYFDAVNVNKFPILPLKRTHRGEFVLIPAGIRCAYYTKDNFLHYTYGGRLTFEELQFHGVDLRIWHLFKWEHFLNNMDNLEEAANEWIKKESN